MKFIKCLAAILAALMVLCIAGSSSAYAKDLTIKDIDPDSDAYSYAQWVVGQGYMSLTLGKFLPAKSVKRSEFAAIVTKLTGNGQALKVPKTPSFKDVTTKNQFYRQIETAKTYMTSFKSKNSLLFKPDVYITREDAMFSIVKILGYDSDEAVGSNENTDMSLDDVLEDADNISPALIKNVSVGISYELMDLRTVDDKTYFDPKKSITRAVLAELIYNAYQKKDYTAEETADESTPDEGASQSESVDTPATTVPANTLEPINISTTISNSDAVLKMLNIKEGETIDLSDINQSMTGTVTKTNSNPQFSNNISLQNDVIMLGNIITNKNLAYGEESLISFEYAYNVQSSEKGIILIGFNLNSYNNDTNRALWVVPKGRGILVFKIPVTPKKWAETPFRVSADIIDFSSYRSSPAGYTVNLLPSDPGRISIF